MRPYAKKKKRYPRGEDLAEGSNSKTSGTPVIGALRVITIAPTHQIVFSVLSRFLKGKSAKVLTQDGGNALEVDY
jgi:hypothetical protein